MDRIIIIILLLISCFSIVYAQGNIKKSTLKFKNGSSLNGEIINQTDQIIELKLFENEVIEIQKEDVIEISPYQLKYQFIEDDRKFKAKGWYLENEFQIGGSTRSAGYGIHEKVGNFLSPKLSVGLGVAFNHYLLPDRSTLPEFRDDESIQFINFPDYTFIPIYTHVKWYLSNKRLSPFTSLDVGYGIPIKFIEQNNNTSYIGGLYSQASLGLRFASKQKADFCVKYNFSYQNASSEFSTRFNFAGTYTILKEKVNLFRSSISIGWIF